MGDWRDFGLADSCRFVILQPRRQLAERQEAAVCRFHLIRHRALQDDFRTRVVGDFHQPEARANLPRHQGDVRARKSLGGWDSAHWQSTMPVILATDSIFGPVTDRLGSGRLPGNLHGWDTCTREPIKSPTPKITVATRYANGQPEEKQPTVPWRALFRIPTTGVRRATRLSAAPRHWRAACRRENATRSASDSTRGIVVEPRNCRAG